MNSWSVPGGERNKEREERSVRYIPHFRYAESVMRGEGAMLQGYA